MNDFHQLLLLNISLLSGLITISIDALATLMLFYSASHGIPWLNVRIISWKITTGFYPLSYKFVYATTMRTIRCRKENSLL